MQLLSNRSRAGLVTCSISLVVLLGLSAGPVVYTWLTGANVGEYCNRSADCQGNVLGAMGSQCLEDSAIAYCTPSCSTSGDCPIGWGCEPALVTQHGLETGDLDQVCVRPEGESRSAGAPSSRIVAKPQVASR